MKKSLLFALMICLLVFSASNATLTKALTMGDANGIIHDDANIWLYPSTFYNYPDMAVGEFSGTSFSHVGLHYKFKDDNPIMVGFYFTTNQPFALPMGNPFWDYGVQNNDRLDLFVGLKVGENPVGFHFNYISGSRKIENDTIPDNVNAPPNSEEEGISNMSFDLGITMMEGKADIAAGIGLLSWTDIESNAKDETKPTGNLSFYVMGRYFHEMNQKVTLVPHVGFSSESVGYEFYHNYNDASAAVAARMTMEDKYSNTIINVGCGMNYSPAAGILAIGDFGVMLDNTKRELHTDTSFGVATTSDQVYKTNYFTPYFRIGMDAAIFDWLDLRLGARSDWHKQTNDNDIVGATNPITNYTQKTTLSYVTNTAYLGAGFHWGNLKIDCFVDPALLLDGLDFISGTPSSQQMNYQVSLLYEMF